MRCPQCGNETQQGSTFCSRCGARLFAPKPSDVREFMLVRIRPSLWFYARSFVTCGVLIAAGIALMVKSPDYWYAGFAIMGLGVLVYVSAMISRRMMSWSVTSDRIIEQRGLIATRRREMELADIRSVEVDKRFWQRVLNLGDVLVASAASADFAIRLYDIAQPDLIAETVRKARLKRLA
jgi:uncharacterized membrane protein YdbT with pleckstrin-like domain